MDLHLSERVALVTGGAGGIGAAIAETFLNEGCRVAIIDRSPAETNNERLLSISGDLTDADDCRRSVEDTLEHFGRLDILVNNAGVNDSIDLDAGPAAFADSLKKNLIHCYSMAHFAKPHLAEHGGAIVNIGSKVSVTGQGGTSGYAASKGGVMALTREWAIELASQSIRVNAVVPAEVWTDMYERWLGSTENPQQERERITSSIPFEKRFTEPSEIADAVVWLSSERASHVTGQFLFVDGGYTHLDRRATT